MAAGNPLDASAIQELLSESRSRGDYATVLKEFIDSGEAGIEVDTSAGVLAGRSADKVSVGLNNAKKAMNENGTLKITGAENVRVVKRGKDDDARVFLINQARYAELTGAEA